MQDKPCPGMPTAMPCTAARPAQSGSDPAPVAPAVSVVMPVFNVARFVEAAIDSVLAQTFTDFELLIVDDGSTDDSVERCRRFADPRIRIIGQRNRGLAGARNTGIRAARGRYVALLDSDDLWAPTKLAEHVAHLQADPAIGVSYSQSAFIDEHGRSIGYLQRPKLHAVTATDIVLRNPVGNGSAPVLRREALESIRFEAEVDGALLPCYFDERFRQSEDIECWARIALTTRWSFAGIGRPLTLYRVNTGGLSAQIERQLESWDRFHDKMRMYAPVFCARWGGLARAFQLRYLARRAVRMGQGRFALGLVARSIASDARVLTREPARTLVTIGAALAAAALPARVYFALESHVMRLFGRVTV